MATPFLDCGRAFKKNSKTQPLSNLRSSTAVFLSQLTSLQRKTLARAPAQTTPTRSASCAKRPMATRPNYSDALAVIEHCVRARMLSGLCIGPAPRCQPPKDCGDSCKSCYSPTLSGLQRALSIPSGSNQSNVPNCHPGERTVPRYPVASRRHYWSRTRHESE